MFFFNVGSPFESNSILFGLEQVGHSIVTNPSMQNDDALVVYDEQEVLATIDSHCPFWICSLLFFFNKLNN